MRYIPAQEEQFTPTPEAGAALLQTAFENLLLGESDQHETLEALETAFRGVFRYSLDQEGASGQFCHGSVRFVEKFGAQGYLGTQPIILAQETMGAPTEVRLSLDAAKLPLFTIEPVKMPTSFAAASQ